MNGVLVVDKPEGPTSHDVVARARRATGIRRVGHTGTLDPMATGVLPLVFGRATRLARFLAAIEKEYEAAIRFGAATDTYDARGRIVSQQETAAVDPGAVERALAAFRGTYLQQPPPFSARKIGGVRAYALAREQKPVAIAPAEVSVGTLEVLSVEGTLVTIRIACSAGFYVRALAHDLGRALATGAFLERLRRTRSGGFGLDQAIALDALEAAGSTALERLVPMERLLPWLPGVILTSGGARRAAHGAPVGPADLMSPPPASVSGPVRLLDPAGALVGIGEAGEDPGVLHPAVVVV